MILPSKICHFVLLLFLVSNAQAEILWDNWYTITENQVPNSYYNEKAEIVGDRAKIQVNTWTKENGKVVAENLGASAKNTEYLEPLLYNFRTNVNGVEKSIDGTVMNNGKVFSVKITTGSHTSIPLKAEMLPKLILASFFPLWVHKNYKRITDFQPIEFQAIVEDHVEKEVPVIKGTAYEAQPDDFSKQTKTRKLRIDFNRMVCFWYVTPKGDAIRIIIPKLNKEVLKVSKEKAQSFLKGAS